MSKIKVNELDTRSGTTITVAAGKTLAGTDIIGQTQIAANAVGNAEMADDAVGVAELSATGTASATTYLRGDNSWTEVVAKDILWQAVQTAAFTAVAGKGYPCNTTSAAFTVTLPATASVGDQIAIVDYAGTFDSNPVTFNPNGLKINGGTDNLRADKERVGIELTYVDATQGWVVTSAANDGTSALSPTTYSVDFLVIAGGGGGGNDQGGGGGAGGYRASYNNEASGGGGSSESSLTLNAGVVYTVSVGAGGAGVSSGTANPGVDSYISCLLYTSPSPRDGLLSRMPSSA